MKSIIRLIIADDQPLFAECLKIALKNESSSIEVVGMAGNGFEVIDLLRKEQADIILMDIRMPELDGLETLKRISVDYPDIKVIMLTTFAEKQYVQKALASGAKGFLLKDTNPKNLIETIQIIINDMMVFTESVINHGNSASIKDFFPDEETKIPDWFSWLTEREKEILYYLKNKLYNKEISVKMNLSEQTVKNYVSAIYNKIGIHSRKELYKLLT